MKAEDQVKTLENDINRLNMKIDCERGGKLSELESKVHELEKSEAKATAEYKNLESIMRSEVNRKKLLAKSLAEDEKAFKTKKADMAKAESVFTELKEAQQKDQASLEAAQAKLQAVEQGKLSSDDGQDASLQDQLMGISI